MLEITINVKRSKFIASVGGRWCRYSMKYTQYSTLRKSERKTRMIFYCIHFNFKNIIQIDLGIALFIYVIYMINLRYSKSWYYKEDYTKVLGIKLHITLLFKEEGKWQRLFLSRAIWVWRRRQHQIRLCKNKMQHH